MVNALEIIGPVMVGPSSSHTVGALRLAKAASLIAKDFKEVIITLYGSFAETGVGHGTDKAILAGLYGLNADDERIKNIEKILKRNKNKWKYKFRNGVLKEGMHPNTVRFKFISNKSMEIEGASVGGGEIVLNEIDGIKVSISLNKPTMVLKHTGEAETLSLILNKLFDYDVNIYTLKSWMEDVRDMPVSIIEFERSVSEEVVNSINNLGPVRWASFIETDWVGFA